MCRDAVKTDLIDSRKKLLKDDDGEVSEEEFMRIIRRSTL